MRTLVLWSLPVLGSIGCAGKAGDTGDTSSLGGPTVDGQWTGPCDTELSQTYSSYTTTVFFHLDDTLNLVESADGHIDGDWHFVAMLTIIYQYTGTSSSSTTSSSGGSDLVGTRDGDAIALHAVSPFTNSGSSTSTDVEIGFALQRDEDQMTGQLTIDPASTSSSSSYSYLSSPFDCTFTREP